VEKKLLLLSNNRTQVIVEILKIISEEDKYYSLNTISYALNVSERTAQRYLIFLTDVIDEYNKNKKTKFDFKQNSKGVKLSTGEKINVNFLISYLLQKDETIQILISLFIKECSSINDYVNNYFLTTYTVKQSISAITDFLNEFDLVVDKKNFTILGNEANIRFLMHNIFWLLYRANDFPEPFSIIDRNKLEDDISLLIESLGISTDNVIKERDLMFRIAISLLRYRKNCSIKLYPNQKKIIPKYNNSFGNPTLYEVIENLLSNHLISDKEEINYLILSFLNNNLLYTSKSLKNQLLTYHKKMNTDVFRATNLFLEKFQYYVGEIPVSKIDIVYDFVFRSHLISVIQQHKFNDYHADTFDTIKNKYPEYVNNLKKIINELKESEKLSLFNNENYLLNRYIMLKYFLDLKFYKYYPLR